MEDLPLHRLFDLGELTGAGRDVAIAAKQGDLETLARWLEVDAVKSFSAVVTLRRLSQTRISYAAELTADIVQSCVVTLEPIESRIARPVTRELLLTDRVRKASGVQSLTLGDEEAPEEIDSPRYDLCVPLLEDLVLAIDPYPRKEGVALAAPESAAAPPESPFAALKDLKIKR
jgi:hypothetical protein